MFTTKMSIKTRKEYLKKVKKRYLGATKPEKSLILSEFVRNSGYHQKYAIKILAPAHEYKSKCINRKIHYKYTNEDIYWLKKIWEIMDYSCGQRLAPQLSGIMSKLVKFRELLIPEATQKKLASIAPSTIDSRLVYAKREARLKINSTTRPGSMIKKQIPIRTVSWDEHRIGCCEMDTVAHCGTSAKGDFISSLDLTDILTGWTETEAILGKAQSKIIAGLNEIKNRLPFPLIAVDPDNGSEFINWQLFNYCLQNNVEFTRGRPYAKNDNAHIEQKNWTHVRKVFGYKRRETEIELELMNDLYRNEIRLYKNFFMANTKLIEKKRIGQHSQKIKKIYDKAKTPYQRVLLCEQVDEATKQRLREQYDTLNPADLRRRIQTKMAKLDKANQLIINNLITLNQPATVTFSNRSTN